ncbi:RHS repeat domain-containing protein [Verminephrobacter aporrectodeae]|uniref:RHS repeat domain-containing protein n=1 Tax=Verminephrobacter aporrectodeae TaxID=1110389 RepID=UPI002238EB7B|nr:RHS repeat-associated core domain-containing protein [Verminephrobacter aporrectodeae]MCW5255359.1 hypothetical protein [Verminephrobacter aporrectodeae subsp. tuberculatae]
MTRSMLNRFLARAVLLLGSVALGANAMAQATITYFHNDIAGTPMMASNASGVLVWKESYLPYGQRQRETTTSAGNKLWFAGKPYDSQTGLSYMGARYYMPLTGRFTGIDPKDLVPEQPHSFNRYAYANNNPNKYVDPDGKFADTIWDAFSLTLGFQSLRDNISVGNWPGAATDVAGIALDGAAIAVPGIPGGAAVGIAAYRGTVVAAKGIGADAQFAQKTYGAMFSKHGNFSGKSVDDVAAALRSGALKPSEVPIDYIVRDGKTIILNTRSAQALSAAGRLLVVSCGNQHAQ